MVPLVHAGNALPEEMFCDDAVLVVHAGNVLSEEMHLDDAARKQRLYEVATIIEKQGIHGIEIQTRLSASCSLCVVGPRDALLQLEKILDQQNIDATMEENNQPMFRVAQ